MGTKIIKINNLSESSKVDLATALINNFERGAFKQYLVSRNVQNRTAIYNGMINKDHYNWNTWYNLSDSKKEEINAAFEKKKRALIEDFVSKIDFIDLLEYACEKYSINKVKWSLEECNLAEVEIILLVSAGKTSSQARKEEPCEDMEENTPISFSS